MNVEKIEDEIEEKIKEGSMEKKEIIKVDIFGIEEY